jgi:hypothetical protein
VSAGFYTDDAVQVAMVRGDFPVHRGPFDLFRFADERRDGRALVSFGYDPWWTEPGFKIAMFRPLSSALIALDVRLFGLDARAFHLHSCVWFVALLTAAGLFFAEVLPPVAASLAVLFFAVEEGVTPPVIWLANRSTLVSCTFGFVALFAYVRNRERRGLPWRILEAALFTLALAGGEYAFSVLAYVVAFEFVSKKPRIEQIRGALPAIVPAVAWVLVSAALGYGTYGSAFYLSPITATQEFVHAVGARIPALLADLTLGIPARGWVNAPEHERAWQSFNGLLGMGGLWLIALWTSRELPKRTSEGVRALLFGAALATLPGAGAVPEDRLLVSAAAGAAGVFGAFVAEAVRRVRALPWKDLGALRSSGRRLTECVVAVLLIPVIFKVHGYDTAVRSRETATWMHDTAPVLQKWAMDAEIPAEREQDLCIVVISATDFTTTANLPWLRRLGGHAVPRCYIRLSEARFVHQIARIAPNAIEVSVFGSQFDRAYVDSLYRRANRPVRTGEVVRVPGFTAEVLATVGQNPWLVRFTFDKDLDDPSFWFVHPWPDGLRHVELPPVGKKLRVPGPSIPPV